MECGRRLLFANGSQSQAYTFTFIDPRLLDLGADEAPVIPEIQTSSELGHFSDDSGRSQDASAVTSSHFATSFTGSVVQPKASPSSMIANINASGVNDFDTAFAKLESLEQSVTLDAYTISCLTLWVAKNKSVKPPAKQLRALETLTNAPGTKMLEWLCEHGNSLLVDAKTTPGYQKPSNFANTNATYLVRCLETGFRYRPRKSDRNESNVFECTNQCGLDFQRKGDWCRHEKVNFEEWICPHCSKILSRQEHLQKHLKAAHPAEPDSSKHQRRETLKASQRPCGFCRIILTTWTAWLFHVAAHFERHFEVGKRSMEEWIEYRMLEKDMETTATANDAQIMKPSNQRVSSDAYFRPSEAPWRPSTSQTCGWDTLAVTTPVVSLTTHRRPALVSEDDMDHFNGMLGHLSVSDHPRSGSGSGNPYREQYAQGQDRRRHQGVTIQGASSVSSRKEDKSFVMGLRAAQSAWR
jgi:hypothetical protein